MVAGEHRLRHQHEPCLSVSKAIQHAQQHGHERRVERNEVGCSPFIELDHRIEAHLARQTEIEPETCLDDEKQRPRRLRRVRWLRSAVIRRAPVR